MGKMEKGYCINLKNGMIIHRFRENEERDNMCVLFAPISDKVADAIFTGRVKPVDVIGAINNHIRNSPEFDLEKFIEDREKMNVRIAKVNLEDLADSEDGDADAPIPHKSDISLEEIEFAKSSRLVKANVNANCEDCEEDGAKNGSENCEANGESVDEASSRERQKPGKRGRVSVSRASVAEDAVDSLL